jgi:hypothetical protein
MRCGMPHYLQLTRGGMHTHRAPASSLSETLARHRDSRTRRLSWVTGRNPSDQRPTQYLSATTLSSHDAFAWSRFAFKKSLSCFSPTQVPRQVVPINNGLISFPQQSRGTATHESGTAPWLLAETHKTGGGPSSLLARPPPGMTATAGSAQRPDLLP